MSRRLARALEGLEAGPFVSLPPIGERPAFLAAAYQSLALRCPCPVCVRLDREFPGEGYQLALFPYRIEVAPR